jgi:hypothetical protein
VKLWSISVTVEILCFYSTGSLWLTIAYGLAVYGALLMLKFRRIQ